MRTTSRLSWIALPLLLLGFALVGSSATPHQRVSAAPPPPTGGLEFTPTDTFSGVERIVAIGDVHGHLAGFEAVLRLAGLLDGEGAWSGGKTHLVQTGDVPDRGDDTRRIFDLLMRLEAQAARAGGRVHALLGNHEAMNLLGDLRYLTPGERASFADLSPQPDLPGSLPGTLGHRAAFAEDGLYGRWLRAHPAVVRINDSLFLHGGISPEHSNFTLKELNHWVRQDLFRGQPRGGASLATGPLWYRGYANEHEAGLAPGLETVLSRHGARRMVMGHTVTGGKIVLRFGGRAVFIDCGMNPSYGGHLAALELRGETLTALYPTGPQVLVASPGPTQPLQ